MNYLADLNRLRAEGWTINMFSDVRRTGEWVLNARKPGDYQWTSYAHPDLEILVREFVNDHLKKDLFS